MPGEFESADNSLDNFDVGAASASIASDLGFGGSGPGAGEEVSPIAPPAHTDGTATPPPPPPAAPPTSAPEPWRALPKAWKKEMEPHWGTMTPEQMQYAHQREADVSRGFQQYQTGHENWNKVLSPYQDMLSQHPDVDPVSLLGNLMQSHLTLIQGTPEQKQVIARQLLQAYNIDLGEPAPEATQAIAALQQRLDSYEQRESKAKQDAHVQEVTTFMNDPANPHAQKVWQHMRSLLAGGGVKTLKEAYEQACWLDPTVRAELTKAESDAALAAAAKVNKLNVRTPDSPSNTAPRKVVGWEAAADAIAAKHAKTGPKH